MATKLYLHNAATTVGGTLPAASATVSTATPAQTPALANKSMNTTIGAAQASVALTTLANTAIQSTPIGRWISLQLSAGFTISAQSITVSLAGNESNTSSVFGFMWALAVWRPSTGAVIGRMEDRTVTGLGNLNFTAETAASTNRATSTSVTALTDDVLILEVWRDTSAQSMGTAYTNTIFYDGTTEASTSTNAAFVNFGTSTLTFSAGTPASARPDPIRQPAGAGNSRGSAVHRAAAQRARV